MNISGLIGQRVFLVNSRQYGKITSTDEKNHIFIRYNNGSTVKMEFPTVFENGTLEAEDMELIKKVQEDADPVAFNRFCNQCANAIDAEIDYLKRTGGKRYKAVDGKLIQETVNGYYYAFDTDTELHFADGTQIHIMYPDHEWINAYVISTDDFTLILYTAKPLPENLGMIDFTADTWQLLGYLSARVRGMQCKKGSIAYQLVCQHNNLLDLRRPMARGQDQAVEHARNYPITFIWGPPGTGKTKTLADIASECMKMGYRILMVSHSNVSVDEALLRVANIAYQGPGKIVRYGYPRNKTLLDDPEHKLLTTYQLAIHRHPDLEKEYQDLQHHKDRLTKKDPRMLKIDRRIASIRIALAEEEKQIVHDADFIATTITKATTDTAISEQRFDVVMFDEASMAYIPQVVFAGSLAQKHFCVFGDFQQLPAIVQDNENALLKEDIYSYVKITDAYENTCYHEWLVLLDVQHRMHRDIADFVGTHMYQGLLKTASDRETKLKPITDLSPFPGEAMGMIDLSGMYSVCSKLMDGSHINVLSALIAVKLAEQIGLTDEVGIITPYSGQARLILSMIRDLQESGEMLYATAATVHQFQGSEKSVIIYDAVDCYRMRFVGVLLSGENANRLFNVAMTRAEGKFILIANYDFMKRKKLKNSLLFSQEMALLQKYKYSGEQTESEENSKESGKATCLEGNAVLNQLYGNNQNENFLFLNEKDAWDLFLEDLRAAKRRISIFVPGVIDNDDEQKFDIFVKELKEAEKRGVKTTISAEPILDLPESLAPYRTTKTYVDNPMTLIDGSISWFGEPLYQADFITSEGLIQTEYYPYVRFHGRLTGRFLGAVFDN